MCFRFVVCGKGLIRLWWGTDWSQSSLVDYPRRAVFPCRHQNNILFSYNILDILKQIFFQSILKRNRGNVESYFLAGRTMPWFAVRYFFRPVPTGRRILTHLRQTTFENIVARGIIAQNEHVFQLPQCFKIIQ